MPWDPGVQNERTGLSWQRTLLSGLTCTLLLTRLLATIDVMLAIALGAAALGSTAALGFAAIRRYVRNNVALTGGRVVEDGLYPLGITLLVTCTALGAVGYVLII